jgi:hypothetical protein
VNLGQVIAAQAEEKEADGEEPVVPTKKKINFSEIGRLGGLRGGPARAQKLSPERRREIARLGGIARQYEKPKQEPTE